MMAEGKREGTVVVGGPPEQETRTQLTTLMKQRFGIDVQYLTQTSSQIASRLSAERAANQYTVDVMLAGSDTAYSTLLGQGWADPLKPALLMPGVADAAAWKTGGPWFRDSQQQYVLQVFNSLQPILTINTQLVPDSITTADQLLDPKYKGKIAAFDPTVNGIGVQVGAALYASKGEDYLKKLYVGQGVALTQDYRQVADWAAHGNYPLAIGVAPAYLDSYKQAGITFSTPEMSDAHSAVQGGFGLVVLLNHAPHPNAARVLANFIASKEGLTMYSQTQQQVPVRSDIDPTWLPKTLIPQTGVAYYDGYDPQFLATRRAPVLDFFKKLLK
ncbi:MAG: ABC transporter substrate-binding protein [Chloroflexi bacterium]|nr:ABC transporter substrate-binding protein [Chloroflexota bacterium]